MGVTKSRSRTITENLPTVDTWEAFTGTSPLPVNAARPAGEWQELDVVLNGRWVTLVLNGETVIDQQEIPGITGGDLDSNESEPGPIYLQGDHGAVSYRNIVLTPALE